MSESKSDALTNLATPLHRWLISQPPLTFQSAHPNKGCSCKLRHILPTQAAGSDSCGNVAMGRRVVPELDLNSSTLAKTALPEPVMRLLPKRSSSQLATKATSGHRSVAGSCRSLRPKPPPHNAEPCTVPGSPWQPSREPKSITGSVSRLSLAWLKISCVDKGAAGLTTA